MKYWQKVKVKSWFYEWFTWEVTEAWNRIRVQNEIWNVLEPESNLELI